MGEGGRDEGGFQERKQSARRPSFFFNKLNRTQRWVRPIAVRNKAQLDGQSTVAKRGKDGQLEMIISTLFSFCSNAGLFVCIFRRMFAATGGEATMEGAGQRGISWTFDGIMRRDSGYFFHFGVYFYILL